MTKDGKSRLAAWKVPLTLNNWRWACQEALAISLAALPSRIEPVDDFFGGNGRWVVPAACTVIEKTAGASTIRMVDRYVGEMGG